MAIFTCSQTLFGNTIATKLCFVMLWYSKLKYTHDLTRNKVSYPDTFPNRVWERVNLEIEN